MLSMKRKSKATSIYSRNNNIVEYKVLHFNLNCISVKYHKIEILKKYKQVKIHHVTCWQENNQVDKRLQLPEPARRWHSSQLLALKWSLTALLIVSYLLICLPATDRSSIKLILDASWKQILLEVWAKLLLYLLSTTENIINQRSDKPWASWCDLKTNNICQHL